MEYANIKVSGNQLQVLELHPITAGTVGARVDIQFDEGWDGLSRTLVWRGSQKTVCDPHCTGNIPHEVLAKPNTRLWVGVYGTKDSTATPTVWADLGTVLPGADPSTDPAADPTLPMWAVLKADMGNVDKALDTILAIQEGLL